MISAFALMPRGWGESETEDTSNGAARPVPSPREVACPTSPGPQGQPRGAAQVVTTRKKAAPLDNPPPLAATWEPLKRTLANERKRGDGTPRSDRETPEAVRELTIDPASGSQKNLLPAAAPPF